jgi:cell division protein FtsQ
LHACRSTLEDPPPPQHVSAAQIAHAVRTSARGNFFTIDLAAVRTGIEALPWVRRAAVRRAWPAGLAVTLEEHEAAAQWRHLGTELEFVIMVIAVSCVKLLSAHNSTQHTSRKHKV